MNKKLHCILSKTKYGLLFPYRFVSIIYASIMKNKIYQEKKNKKNKKIKVGFIVQMPEVWDKEAPVYEKMVRDNRFECYLIVVPHFDFTANKLSKYSYEKQFFQEKYPNTNIILLNNEKHNPIDSTYDYVFYQRCWENYLPKQLRCKNIIKYAMTCYIPYCYHAGPDPLKYYNKEFFWYLSKFYCCSAEQYDVVKDIRWLNSKYLGFPIFESLKYKDIQNEKYNILWTPRWTDDKSLGGTSFLAFKTKILEILKIDKRINLSLRPHPLMFENAVKNHWMTNEDVSEYKKLVVNTGATFDENKFIEETFFNTDILITDFSSAIITFYVSGRPIIYCTQSNFPLTKIFKKIMDSIYIAKDINEVKEIIAQLLVGNDPLYEKRQKVIREINGSDDSSIERILNDLVEYITKIE